MTQIPIGETAFEGVRLIARRPLAVLIWAAILFVATAVPIALLFGTIGPAFAEILKQTSTGAEPSPADILALDMKLMAINPLLTLCSLVGRVVLMCAIFRAVLEPQDSRFGYVRLGKAELLTGLVYLCLVIIFAMLMVAGLLLVAGFAVAGYVASRWLGIALGLLLALALLIAVFWVGLRLALAMPMTFAERRFRLFESWERMRGHVLQLFLVGLLSVVIVLLIEVIVGSVVGVAAIVALATHPLNGAGVEAFFHRPPSEWMGVIAPWLLLGGVIFSILGAALYAVMYAPLAAAYRALVPAAAAETA